jgi:hypothetical protein
MFENQNSQLGKAVQEEKAGTQIITKNYPMTTPITQAQYDALPAEQKARTDIIYLVKEG